MTAPQITMVLLMLAGLLIAAHEHGKPKKGNHNFMVHLIALAINLLILFWGGFFK